jgi:hypothetical protein
MLENLSGHLLAEPRRAVLDGILDNLVLELTHLLEKEIRVRIRVFCLWEIQTDLVLAVALAGLFVDEIGDPPSHHARSRNMQTAIDSGVQ